MTVATRYIVVNWRDLPRWDTKTARASGFRLAHPGFRPLGNFAEEATELVRPWDKPDAEWPVYGVTNEAGVVFSHYQRGNAFKAPYKRIRKDWFFHNPTRANIGSLGRVPDVPADAVTSPEYQVWRIRGELLPTYVEILIQTAYFMEQIACHRVGAVKERLFVQNLLEIPIPVVPIEMQRKIVAAWEASRKALTATTAIIEQLEHDIGSRFLADLGLKVPTQTTLPKVFVLMFSKLERWGVGYNQQSAMRLDPAIGKYPVVRLGEVIADLENGWSPKCLDRPAEDGEWAVLKMGAVSFGIFDEGQNKAIPETLARRPDLEVKPGDFLISRANITRLVGACALVRTTRAGLMLCDKIFRAVWRSSSPIAPQYLDEILKVPYLRQQIEGAVTGTSATMKNITKPSLLALRLPLPPLPVQQQIVERIGKLRAEIARLKADAKTRADAAKEDIEAMILGTKPVS
jgi:type I restriction enzyme S subunit